MIVVVFTQLYTCVKFNQLDTLNCSWIAYKFYLNETNLKAFSRQNYPLMGEKIYDEKEHREPSEMREIFYILMGG